jgi:murein DD-endopeptidase MepM/ murein hydrolase activator NlpD
MSSLHPNRLSSEGAAPDTAPRKSLPTDGGTTSRPNAGTVSTTAQGTARPATDRTAALIPAQRTGKSRAGNLTTASSAADRSTDRPTPHQRTRPTRPVAVEETVPVAAERPRGWRTPSVRRRPALYLAAALVGAATLSAVTAGGPAAHAGTQAQVSESVSVAEALGVGERGEREDTVTAADVDRLEEVTASRAERDAEQTAAKRAQLTADKKAKAAAEARAREAARPKAVLPVKGARLTSTFGPRWGTLHAGIDLAAPMRTPEYAAMDGVVLEAGPASGYGLAVYIQHENGDVTVYGHMDEILVSAGQVVKAGDTIALLGNRGQSTGPHLHFEVHQGGLDGKKIDPLPWLRARGIDI